MREFAAKCLTCGVARQESVIAGWSELGLLSIVELGL